MKPSDSERQNRLAAGYLALVAGFVNSTGFLLIGSFTSHVTGSVGRLANDVASHNHQAALSAFLLVFAFFLGSFVASMMLETSVFSRATQHGLPTFAYGIALLSEALLLTLFLFLAQGSTAEHPRIQDAEAALLCMSMGLQNSLVTRLSGMVVRTTHLTGVVTDLGIEAARWFRWHRAHFSQKMNVRLLVGHCLTVDKPVGARVVTLSALVVSFLIGAMAGAVLTVRVHHLAMLVPIVAVLLASSYAFRRALLASLRSVCTVALDPYAFLLLKPHPHASYRTHTI